MFRATYEYSSMSMKLNSPHSLSLGAHYRISSVILGILGEPLKNRECFWWGAGGESNLEGYLDVVC